MGDKHRFALNGDPHDISGMAFVINDGDEPPIELEKSERKIIDGAKGLSSGEINEKVDVAEMFQDDISRIEREFKEAGFSGSLDAGFDPELGPPHKSSAAEPTPQRKPPPPVALPKDSELKRMTMEGQYQDQIRHVMRSVQVDPQAIDEIAEEKDSDDKLSMLQDIDVLRETLEAEGANLSSIQKVTEKNTLSEIQDVYKRLRLKDDTSRSTLLCEEIIQAACSGIESLCNGKNEWFGHKPDLTGWSETVKVKLKRLRCETTTAMRSVMSGWQMSGLMRVAIEIIPTMFIHSRNIKTINSDSLASSAEYQSAMSKIHSRR